MPHCKKCEIKPENFADEIERLRNRVLQLEYLVKDVRELKIKAGLF